jgi:hypothetical protein
MTARGPNALLLLALALALGTPIRAASGGAGVEIYRPRSRPAESLVDVARALLAPAGGDAVVDPGTGWLVLRGEPGALAETRAALAEIDRTPAMYQVHSSMTTLSDLAASGVAVDGWIEAGDVRVGRVPGPADGIRVRVRSALGEGERRFEGAVSTMDGQPAEIWTGSDYPARARTLHERAGRLRVYETTTLVPVRTGFRVIPRGMGDGSIELEIAPLVEESMAEGLVVHASVASRVRVQPGQAVLVAASRGRDSEVAIDPFGAVDHREGASDSALIVRVDRLGDEGD